MKTLLLTMGPALGITAELPTDARVGEPATIRFRAVDVVGVPRWSLVSTTLPGEWDSALTIDGVDAVLETADAVQWGSFDVTVRCTDDNRVPVIRTFAVYVAPAAIVVTGGTFEWAVGSAVPDSLTIAGGTGHYADVSITAGSLPAGVTARISGANIVFDGVPTATGDAGATVIVTDSAGAMGVASIAWEVTDPVTFVGGGFTTVGGVARPGLVKLMPDGTINSSFTGSINGAVGVVAIAADKKVIAAGLFTLANGVARANFAVFNEDGTLAAGNPITNNDIYAVLPHPNGTCVIGGLFTQAGGTSRNRLARLNADYTLDTSWNPNLNGLVWGHWAYPDGSFLIGGTFTTAFGSTVRRLIRVLANGTRDTTFNPTVNERCYSIVVQPDGKILIGGEFSTVNGVARAGLARLHANGTLDTGFVASTNPGGAVMSIALDAIGRIYVASSFYKWDAVPATRGFARMSSSGVIDWTWGDGGDVQSIAIQPDGKCIVGGNFITMAGTTRNRIARINDDGTLDMTYNPNITGGLGVYWILSR